MSYLWREHQGNTGCAGDAEASGDQILAVSAAKAVEVLLGVNLDELVYFVATDLDLSQHLVIKSNQLSGLAEPYGTESGIRLTDVLVDSHRILRLLAVAGRFHQLLELADFLLLAEVDQGMLQAADDGR